MTERLHFTVVGSSGDPYDLEARRDGHELTFTCTCRAGELGQACKHRLALLDGDVTNLQSDNSVDVETLRQWLPGSRLATALANLDEAESALAAAKREVAGRKKALARVLQGH